MNEINCRDEYIGSHKYRDILGWNITTPKTPGHKERYSDLKTNH